MFTNGKSEVAVYRRRLVDEISRRCLVPLEERRRFALFLLIPSAVTAVGYLQNGKTEVAVHRRKLAGETSGWCLV